MNLTTPQTDRLQIACQRLSVPRREPADSFVLHAPLELMARIGLLPYVDGARVPDVLQAIDDLVDRYEAASEPKEPTAPIDYADAVTAATDLDRRLRDGDVDGVDAPALWLGRHCSAAELQHLVGESIIDSLAAAAHAPIVLHLLRTVAGGGLPPTLVRGPLRELARHPDWRLTWFRTRASTVHTPIRGAAAPDAVADMLRQIPHLGRPGSDFIFPLMSQIESSGVVARLFGPLLDGTVGERAQFGRTLQRAAVWSMINDDPSQAPYGWSHALTMTQAALSLAGGGVDPRTAAAVAATFVAGFRAAHGVVELGSLADDAPAAKAGTPSPLRSVADLAANAACHEDAHLVKYTLACFQLADQDPAWRHHFLVAAQHLADWWAEADAADDRAVGNRGDAAAR